MDPQDKKMIIVEGCDVYDTNKSHYIDQENGIYICEFHPILQKEVEVAKIYPDASTSLCAIAIVGMESLTKFGSQVNMIKVGKYYLRFYETIFEEVLVNVISYADSAQ